MWRPGLRRCTTALQGARRLRLHPSRLAGAAASQPGPRPPAWAAPGGGHALRCFADEKEPTYVSGGLWGYELYHQHEPYTLRSGVQLPDLRIAYETWGELNPQKNNCILLQCGMSASSHAASTANNPTPGWWEEFIGPGRPLDTNLFFVICTNNLGGCYGSSGPSSPHPADGKPFGSRFPRFDVYDQVAVQFHLLDYLGIQKVHACVGSSLGGMQSVCAAGRFADRVCKFVTISACAKSFPGSISFRHSQRTAVMADPNWNHGNYYDGELPANGLRLARQIGTITYRSGQEWRRRFSQKRVAGLQQPAEQGLDLEFEIERYLSHQGEKWVNNYDPNSMLWISKAMDGFTMELPDESGNPCLMTGLKAAMQPALVIGVQHDVLFPVWQQKEIAEVLRAAGNRHVVYYELDSVYGHDTFLLDAVSIGPAVKGHLEQEPYGAKHIWEEMTSSGMRILQALINRGGTADSLRDIFRALAQGGAEVDTQRLKHMVKLVYANKASEQQIDRVFARLPHDLTTLDQFLTIREPLSRCESGHFEI